MMRGVLLLLAFAAVAAGYVPRVVNGVQLRRKDFAQMQFHLNSAAVPGLKNGSGQTFITTDSNPVAAVKAALNTWNNVADSNARFAPLDVTSDINNENDNKNVIVFRDSPEIQSAVNGALAITDIIFNPADGTVFDTDILFNPTDTFSTTLAPGTYDIQAIATHELGHALGANHSGILGAVMYQTTRTGNTAERTLSTDDIAFDAATYPSSSGARYGTLAGSVSAGGPPLRGALITAVDPASGVTVGALSDFSTGQYSMKAPPGSYVMYAEPLSGQVKPGNLYISSLSPGQAIDTSFEPGPIPGAGPYVLSPAATTGASFSTTAGTSSVSLVQTAVGPAGGTADTFMIFGGPQIMQSGGASDLLMFGPGIDANLTEQNFTLLGPATIRPGSLRRDNFASPTIMRMTIDVPARMDNALASLLINKNGQTAAFSGGLILVPPAPIFTSSSIANAFSGVANGVAPGEDISIYGANLGPATGVLGLFDITTGFATSVDGVSVMFDGVAAPLLFVRNDQINVQVPYEVSGNAVTNIVVTYNGSVSSTITANVVPVHPGLYPTPINADGTLNSASAPAKPGTYVTLYALGLGNTTNQPATGKPAPANPLAAAIATRNRFVRKRCC